MQVHAVQTTSQQDSDRPSPVSPYAEFMFRLAERFGVPTVLCLLIMWWAKTGIVEPLMEAHFQFISKIVLSQEQHTDALDSLGDKLDTLIQVSRHAAQKEKAD